ncbi:MAG TPA: hypothetical protein VJV97_06965 [Gemmatimonadaceae bacterium]|nr:hypothetical protein [Gemmatimonadaceae bacterium]
MEESDRRGHWGLTAILFGLVYFVAGIVSGGLAAAAASTQGRTAWRLAAWVASAAAFAAHIRYEHVRMRSSPVRTAWHTAAAVALGAFGLAAAANIRAQITLAHARPLLRLSLLIWPVMSGIPAFVVALAAAAFLARTRRSA